MKVDKGLDKDKQKPNFNAKKELNEATAVTKTAAKEKESTKLEIKENKDNSTTTKTTGKQKETAKENQMSSKEKENLNKDAKDKNNNKELKNVSHDNINIPNVISVKKEEKEQIPPIGKNQILLDSNDLPGKESLSNANDNLSSKDINNINNSSNNLLSEKENKSIFKKFQLDVGEIIEKNEEIITPKRSKLSFNKSLLNQKLNEAKSQFNIEENLLKVIKNSLSQINNTIITSVKDNQLFFNEERKSIEEIILQKENKKNKADIEEHIRQQKLKEIMENKESIGIKIKTLEENMKLLEGETGLVMGNLNQSKIDLNNSVIVGRDLVDDNIRKSRIKEIKQTKENLEKKLMTLDEQVHKLISDEEINRDKKFNLKQFLDNFEKDKAEAVLRTKKWESDQKERLKHLIEIEEKAKLKFQQKENENLNQIKLREQEKEEAYRKSLKNRKKQEKKNINQLKEEWSKNKKGYEYFHKKHEKDFHEEFLKEEEEKQNEIRTKLLERRNNSKQVNREEINEFSKRIGEERQKLIYEKQRERMNKLEEIHAKNESFPKSDTVFYQKAVGDAKSAKDLREKELHDKIYKNLKIKQFSEIIKSDLLPRIDEKLKKEIEDRVKSRSKSRKKKRSRSKARILLRKPDPNKPKKYKWKLKLNSTDDLNLDDNKKKNRSRSRSARSYSESVRNKSRIHKDLIHEDLDELDNKKRKSNSRSGEKRKPMEKLPDYLTEIRIKKQQTNYTKINLEKDKEKKAEKKWQKMINNNKYSLIENVEQIKIKANMLEEKAKMKEKFLQLNGGAEKNPEIGEDVSNMLIDAIKAKLTILENISTKKNK